VAGYFTADLHLGHRNIIDYSSRPFRDAGHMNDALVERWYGTVAPKDDVIVLGDFAMGRIDEALPIAGLLNGRKVLLAGNHDRCWHGHKRGVDAAIDRYLDAESMSSRATFRIAARMVRRAAGLGGSERDDAPQGRSAVGHHEQL
jgi:calcineurin-like phosphoesterase family protein